MNEQAKKEVIHGGQKEKKIYSLWLYKLNLVDNFVDCLA